MYSKWCFFFKKKRPLLFLTKSTFLTNIHEQVKPKSRLWCLADLLRNQTRSDLVMLGWETATEYFGFMLEWKVKRKSQKADANYLCIAINKTLFIQELSTT